MNARRRRNVGLKDRTRELVDDVFRTLQIPQNADVTDAVLCAIEANGDWRRRFDDLSEDSDRGTICSLA